MGVKKVWNRYKEHGLVIFLLLYLIYYTTDAASGYFMIFLKSIGLNTLQMGFLTAGAALTALVFQPYVGRMADRAKTKNTVLIVTLLCAAFLALLLRLSSGFIYIMLVYTGYLILRNTLHPLVDSITLEHTSAKGVEFGPIRTMGCIGYAIMAAVAGRIAQRNPADSFVVYAFAALATVIVALFLPRSYGRQRGKKRIHPLATLSDRRLAIYILFAVALSCTKSFYSTYFSVYYTSELGGSTDQYGILLSIAAFMEIPVIFVIDRLNHKFGTRNLILIAGMIETIRWLATAIVANPLAQVVIQAILGSNNMTLALSMTIFVDRAMPPETRTTGQATYTMCTSVGSLVVGNLIGGALSNALGIRPVFLLCVTVNVVALSLFALIGYMEKAKTHL